MSFPTQDDHDEGLGADLRAMARRRMLGGLGAMGLGAAGAWLLSTSLSHGEATVSAMGADGKICVNPADETAGPFPADGTNTREGQTVNALTTDGVLRRDLRGSFGGLKGTAGGLPLHLELRLLGLADGCASRAGLALYLWHCDASGRYSIYDVPEVNYLRGLGVSDAHGVVRFTTVFPGCYPGRWPHMHFQVFASPDAAVHSGAAILTSQLALPKADCNSVYGGTAGYAASKDSFAGLDMAADMVFADNTPEQNAAMTLTIKRDPMAGASAKATLAL